MKEDKNIKISPWEISIEQVSNGFIVRDITRRNELVSTEVKVFENIDNLKKYLDKIWAI